MINSNQIDKEITTENLKQIKIITIAMNLGIALFLIVCFVLYSSNNIRSDETELIDILIGILFLLTSLVYGLASFLPNKILKQNLSSNNANLLGAFTTYQIIKLALYEASALFGLVIIVLSITNGAIYSNSYIFIATAPAIAMFAVSIFTFPTEYSVKSLLKAALEELKLTNN
jgi:hypothetical protein